MVKHKSNFLQDSSPPKKVMEIIEDILPELIRTRDRLNATIAELQYHQSTGIDNHDTLIAKITMRAVMDHFDVSKYAIESKSRDTTVRMARQVFMAITKDKTGLSLASVGAFVHRDHSTVKHAMKVVANTSDAIYDHYKEVEKHVDAAFINVSIESTKEVLLQAVRPAQRTHA